VQIEKNNVSLLFEKHNYLNSEANTVESKHVLTYSSPWSPVIVTKAFRLRLATSNNKYVTYYIFINLILYKLNISLSFLIYNNPIGVNGKSAKIGLAECVNYATDLLGSTILSINIYR